jgi:hypothetical protein
MIDLTNEKDGGFFTDLRTREQPFMCYGESGPMPDMVKLQQSLNLAQVSGWRYDVISTRPMDIDEEMAAARAAV